MCTACVHLNPSIHTYKSGGFMFLTNRNGIFYLNYMDIRTGTYKRVSTTSRNEREAYRFLESFSKQEVLSNNSTSIKLSTFQLEYINYMKKTHSPKYISSIELTFRKIIKHIGDINLDRLNNKVLEEFIATIFTKSQAAASLYYRTLKASLNKAVSWEYLTMNPLVKVKLPKMQKKDPLFIKPEEFQQIILNTKSNLLRDLFTIAFYTGMRLGEVVNMRWSWIDFSNKLIKVKVSEMFITKSKKERTIPMNKTVFETIDTLKMNLLHKDNDGYVFHIRYSVKLNEDYVSKNFKKAVRKTNLNQNIHFHTLRHSFASNLIQNGASIFVCKELLGHEDIKTTMIYSHLDYKNLVDAVKLLESA